MKHVIMFVSNILDYKDKIFITLSTPPGYEVQLVSGNDVMDEQYPNIKKFTFAGIVITLGIVFGDLGTSPLYAMRAIITGGAENYNHLLIYGGLSCIFWTLTLSTTVKYVIIALKADNNGEGGDICSCSSY